MQKNKFFEDNQPILTDFVQLSQTAGARSDYVQGGGGNTSCKLDDQLMAIKASGYRLDQIRPDQAYAVLDYQLLRRFYAEPPVGLADLEAAGSAQASQASRTIAGLDQLRPSVEAGFHALLDTFVLHTHSVYANLAACSADGEQVAARALAGIGAEFVFIPYINPGAQLTLAIQTALQQKEAETGRRPQLLILQNHGFIVTGPDAASCLQLHEAANQQLAAAFAVSTADWPATAVEPHADIAGLFGSATPWLADRLKGLADLDLFIKQPLYPDQMVFLDGKIALASPAEAADPEAFFQARPEVCLILPKTGQVFYKCSYNEARTIEQTLCAVLFINSVIQASGARVINMSQAGQDFISGWESEQYRKKIAEK